MDWPGEDQAWSALSGLNPLEVQRNSCADHDSESRSYSLLCFGQTFVVAPHQRSILTATEFGRVMLNEVSEFFRLSILFYLSGARDIPLSQKLIRPDDIPGGDIFSRGTHVLPLPSILDSYEHRLRAFIDKGLLLGGIEAPYGDASVTLFPFPRIPVTLIIWTGDEEFPAKASFLFDSTCSFQASTDILWSTAMMSVTLMTAK